MVLPLKILLLEDNADDAEIVRKLLKKANPEYEFCLAMNKEAYFQALDQFQPDIILSDNALPQFNALEALQIIQQRSLHIPFILVTGTASDEFAANIIKSGADDYFLKDRLTRLPVAINAALKHRQLEKEKQEAVNKLIQSEEKYRTLFFKSPLPKWIYDLETLRFLEVNETAINHYGYTSEEFLSMTLKDIWHREELELLSDSLSSRIPENPDNRKSNWTHQKKDGELIIVEATTHFIEYNNRKARMVIVNDITERIEADKQKVQEQKKVTRAIIKAQEKERNHIGRELHDNINQILASTKLYLSMAGDKKPELKELIKYPLGLIESAISEIRALTSGYVAPLKHIDLQELIQILLDKLADHSGIGIIFKYNVTKAVIGDELKLNIYRIIQEQINNIVKHANAKNVSVIIETDNKTTNILIADDGNGLDRAKKRKGIGLSNMINRIESFNGKMEIESFPDNGCKIRVCIPI